MMAYNQAQGNPQHGFNNIPAMDFNNNNFPGPNNNNNNNNNNFPGFGNAGGFSSDDLSIDGLNSALIKQLKFMTNSLASMMKQVANDPRANEVFKVMDKICVSNM